MTIGTAPHQTKRHRHSLLQCCGGLPVTTFLLDFGMRGRKFSSRKRLAARCLVRTRRDHADSISRRIYDWNWVHSSWTSRSTAACCKTRRHCILCVAMAFFHHLHYCCAGAIKPNRHGHALPAFSINYAQQDQPNQVRSLSPIPLDQPSITT